MIAYFCHHFYDYYADLLYVYIVLSDIYVNLSDIYVNLEYLLHVPCVF